MSSFYERYVDGKHEEVWDELFRLGELVNDDRYLDDATAVAWETMRRARENIETIVGRLSKIGYQFSLSLVSDGTPRDVETEMYGTVSFEPEQVVSPPSLSIDDDLCRIEEAFGILPLSLAAWYQQIGSVDLTGRHPKLCDDYLAHVALDGVRQRLWIRPLVVYPVQVALVEYGDVEDDRRAPPVLFPLAPNYDQGFNGIHVPDSRADAVCTITGQRFVEYLRTCFKHGGFPGWGQYPVRPEAELRYLSDGLLPI